MKSLSFLVLVLLLLHIIALPIVVAQTRGNITRTSFLTTATAGIPNLSWLSPSRDFAFGFLPLPTNSSLFLISIWFSNLPNATTVIWTLNRNKPLAQNSSIILTSDGQLSVRDPVGTEVWSPNAPSASYGSMLDTGDFVLVGRNGSILWESFSNPTDTIVPTQTLNPNTKLVAKLNDDDFSEGRFKMEMQPDGNLVFYQIAVPTGYQYSPYWASNTKTADSMLVFNLTGTTNLITPQGSILTTLTSATTKSTSDFYHRATLDQDGVFRHYIHPKPSSAGAAAASGGGGGGGDWFLMDLKPPNICQSLLTNLGTGACGFNSYCAYDTNQMVSCQCTLGYSWLDSEKTYLGCKPNFTMPDCISGVPSNQFQMVRVEKLDFWGQDYDKFNPMNEAECMEQCLNDCFCVASIIDYDNTCWKKKLPLSNGRKGNYVNRTAFIKVGNGDNLTVYVTKKRNWILPGSLLLGVSVLLNFIILALSIVFLRVSKRKQREKLKDGILGPNLKAFTYKELEEMTNGFTEELGRGACGTVYKGYLNPNLTKNPNPDIAVKKLRDFHPEIDKEFFNEVKSIGQTHHKNLVRLLGYCNQDSKRLLVYEYMSNGSLANYLFSDNRPPWEQRVEIILGISRALRYLHEECVSQIIHCDIKPQNVLLDENFVPRISDFGLAKLLKTEQTRTNTGIRGTKGYVAPEWFGRSGISAKVDVYSFGVMILEILFCRRNVEEKGLLTEWVCESYGEGGIVGVVGRDEEEVLGDVERVERFVMVALWCVQEEPSLRPGMGEVTQMLEGAVEIQPVKFSP